jgi:hypothetical protein
VVANSSSLQSGFSLENYIVGKRFRLKRGMTIGEVGYSANFESPQWRGFIKIFEYCENEKEKKILLASKSGAHIE